MIVAVYGSGSPIMPDAEQAGARAGGRASSPGARAPRAAAPPLPSSCGHDDDEQVLRSPSRRLRASGASSSSSPLEVWLATHERRVERQALLVDVADDVLDRQPGGALRRARPGRAAASPRLSPGSVEMMISSGLRVGDRVHRRLERVGVADFAARLDALARRPPTAPGRRAPAPIRAPTRRRSPSPAAGLALRHDQAEARRSPSAARCAHAPRAACAPPSVSLATTRTLASSLVPPRHCSAPAPARRAGAADAGRRRGRWRGPRRGRRTRTGRRRSSARGRS